MATRSETSGPRRPPSKHHYVPEFYLRAWATPDESQAPRLTCFKWVQGSLRADRIAAKGAAHQQDLYARQTDDPTLRQSIESDFLGPRVDGPAALVIKKMLEGRGDLGGDDAQIFARYLLAQRVRIPDYVEHIRSEAAQAVQELLQRLDPEYQKERLSDSPERLVDWLGANVLRLNDLIGIQSFPNLLALPDLISSLVDKMSWGWGQMRARDVSLLTCDNPVVFTHGLSDPRCIVALPLSPTVAFLAASDDARLHALLNRDSAELITRLNLHITSQARRYVYANDASQRAFIEQHFLRPEQQAKPAYRRLRPV